MNKLLRYYYTLKYVEVTQLYFRIIYLLKRKLYSFPFIIRALTKPAPTYKVLTTTNPIRDRWKPIVFAPPETFSFVGETHSLSEGWFPEDASDLWTFNLHYFDYLHEIDTPKRGIQIIEQWINQVPNRHLVGWHPYPTSLRIANWIWFYSTFEESFDDSFRHTFLDSLFDQLSHLRWNLEYHLLGNHLISNLKALIVGGIFFDDKEKVTKGLKVLKRELYEQIEKDGGHFERSPMYHLTVLEDLYAIAKALRDTGQEVPEWLVISINQMVHFGDIIFKDGNFPALNDSSKEIAPPFELLRKAVVSLDVAVASTPSELAGTHHLKETGLVVHHGSSLSVYFDVGPIGPDYLPGHAHNDTLSVLLYGNGEPLLTDSGVYQYAEGEWRHYFRSARAHNVPFINNEEPNDIWKSFRVGFRGYPFDVSVNEAEFSANDSAYKRLGVWWRRTVSLLEGEKGISITDHFVNSGEEIPIEWNFHFAPQLQFIDFQFGEGHNSSQLRSTKNLLEVSVTKGHVALQETTSPYSEEFGKKRDRPCLRGSSKLRIGEMKVEFELRLLGEE